MAYGFDADKSVVEVPTFEDVPTKREFSILENEVDNKAAKNHDHNSIYYTKQQVNDKFTNINDKISALDNKFAKGSDSSGNLVLEFNNHRIIIRPDKKLLFQQKSGNAWSTIWTATLD